MMPNKKTHKIFLIISAGILILILARLLVVVFIPTDETPIIKNLTDIYPIVIDLDEISNLSYTSVLLDFDEKALYKSKGHIYRFTYRPSFSSPIVVRIEIKRNGTAEIYYKTYSDKSVIGELVGWDLHTGKAELSRDETQEFLAVLKEADYWNLQKEIDIYGLDGHGIIIEGVKDRVYKIISRWVPEAIDSVVYNIEEYFFTLIEKKFSAATRYDRTSTIDEIEYVPYSYPHKQPIFDFAVLSEDVFPRGQWTVNELIEKYGTPDEVSALYVPHYKFVAINVHFSGFNVGFRKESPCFFSFYNEELEEEAYNYEIENNEIKTYVFPLDEPDMDFQSEILGLQFEDENIIFPNNIKIGQSTKMQIMDLYPKKAAYKYKSEEYGTDLVSYAYAFRNEEGNLPDYYNNMAEGSIDYYFDENEILKSVGVQWFYSDV